MLSVYASIRILQHALLKENMLAYGTAFSPCIEKQKEHALAVRRLRICSHGFSVLEGLSQLLVLVVSFQNSLVFASLFCLSIHNYIHIKSHIAVR